MRILTSIFADREPLDFDLVSCIQLEMVIQTYNDTTRYHIIKEISLKQEQIYIKKVVFRCIYKKKKK